MRRFLFVPAAALVFACAAQAPKPTEAVGTPVTIGPSPSAPLQSTAIAPNALQQHWVGQKTRRVAAFFDAHALVQSALFKQLVSPMLPMIFASTPERTRACVDALLASVREVAVSDSKQEGTLVLLRLDRKATSINLDDCASEHWGDANRAAASDDTTVSNRRMVARENDVFMVGERDLVERARRHEVAPWPPALVLTGDTIGVLSVDLRAESDNVQVEGIARLAMSEKRFAVAADLETSPELAQRVESQFNEMRTPTIQSQRSAEESNALDLFNRRVSLSRSNGKLHVAFEVPGDTTVQAKDLGVLAVFGTYSVRNYIVRAKAAEARNTLGQLVRDYISWWESEPPPGDPPRAKRKLFSLPAVPKSVPSGKKFQSAPADWKAWSRLRFEMSDPQYYQYEIKAAKDGESAEVLARGDLNGDGKTSLFRIKLRIDRKRGVLVAEPTIEELNPEE